MRGRDKMDMKDRPKTITKVKNKLKLQSIALLGPNGKNSVDEVWKIEFWGTNEEKFTWKPKKYIETEIKVQGFKKKSREAKPLTINELPKIIHTLNELCESNQTPELEVELTKMETIDNNGENVTYYFIMVSPEKFHEKIKLLKPLGKESKTPAEGEKEERWM